jgi:hypothetical protein
MTPQEFSRSGTLNHNAVYHAIEQLKVAGGKLNARLSILSGNRLGLGAVGGGLAGLAFLGLALSVRSSLDQPDSPGDVPRVLARMNAAFNPSSKPGQNRWYFDAGLQPEHPSYHAMRFSALPEASEQVREVSTDFAGAHMVFRLSFQTADVSSRGSAGDAMDREKADEKGCDVIVPHTICIEFNIRGQIISQTEGPGITKQEKDSLVQITGEEGFKPYVIGLRNRGILARGWRGGGYNTDILPKSITTIEAPRPLAGS